MTHAYIVDAVRSPRGKKKGSLVNTHPMDLMAHVLSGLAARQPKLPLERIEDVILGCVTPVGEQGFNIARGAALNAGWPIEVPGTTINRFCGSGQQAVHFAAQAVMAGSMDVVVAGGIESMLRVPMGSDGVGGDGPLSKQFLERYPDLVPQGLSAEMVAEKWGLTRKDVDTFAAESQRRAAIATEQGRFKNEILPIEAINASGEKVLLSRDEHQRPSTTVDSLAALQPAFKGDGVITAGNSSGIVDGASAVLVVSEVALKKYGLTPRARITAMSVAGSEPKIMLTGPIPATKMVLEKAKLKLSDIDLFEVNEAFASVPLAWAKELGADLAKTNVNGGAIALGHPLGATGGILFATLLNELERTQQRYGLITMCIGYGMGTATVIDRQV
ncbi:MAG: thiolase family protein [Deltaproteobacteria bacterium]|nr:thiolase family protein [Deltaproteobacteria bacterium]